MPKFEAIVTFTSHYLAEVEADTAEEAHKKLSKMCQEKSPEEIGELDDGTFEVEILDPSDDE
jgi:hypothetical protein